MRLQDSQANCGPASLYNGLMALGIPSTQADCAAACGTTATDGTPPKGIIKGAKSFGRQPLVINERRGTVATLWLLHFLGQGRPVLLCVDKSDHWVTAIAVLGDRILVADPADNELVLSLTKPALATRWGETAVPSKHHYYGIVL